MPQPSKSALTRIFSQVEFTDGEKEYKAHKRLAFEEVTPMTIKFDRYGKTQAFQNAENVFFRGNFLDVVESDSGGRHFQLSVEKLGLDDDVAVEDARGHHLRLRRRLDQALPGVVRVGDDEAELEVPLLQATAAIENTLLLRTTR